MATNEMVQVTLNETKPLESPRGGRLPLYVWPLQNAVSDDSPESESVLRELDARGIGVITSWNVKDREESLASALRVGALHKRLGLRVSINASSCMGQFCNGDEQTAHITEEGEAFFDNSFGRVKMGCPFALDSRYAPIKEQIEYFVRAYKENGVPIDFICVDFEADGPVEWNKAWESSKRCRRCRENIPDIDDFTAFQAALRTIRSDLQKKVLSDTVLSCFPDALVGNYGVYPHDGYHYWMDHFEDKRVPDNIPHKPDQRATYRQWFDEFPLTGYTFALPVFYTWSWAYKWYDFADSDFRWFYNLLLTATNVCKSTPRDIPVIGFVHFTTIWHPDPPDASVKQFGVEKYKELLWHILLRGCDGLILWCPGDELAQEIKPLHEVYAAALEYRDFLDGGEPVCFEVPSSPGTVISGLRLGRKVLVRRTDFTDARDEVTITVDGRQVRIPPADGVCQVIELG